MSFLVGWSYIKPRWNMNCNGNISRKKTLSPCTRGILYERPFMSKFRWNRSDVVFFFSIDILNGLHTTTKNDMHEFYVNDRALISLLGFSDHLYCVLCFMSILDDISYIEIYFILLIILMSFLSFIHIYFDYEINVLFNVLSYPFYSGTAIQSFSRTTEAGRHPYHGDSMWCCWME